MRYHINNELIRDKLTIFDISFRHNTKLSFFSDGISDYCPCGDVRDAKLFTKDFSLCTLTGAGGA